MNWRWIAPTALCFIAIEFVMGVAAYGSSTWNFRHTEVLTGWAAVREVCLVFAPVFFCPLAVFVFALVGLASWASRGGRR